jgi:ankyrin repeat protein
MRYLHAFAVAVLGALAVACAVNPASRFSALAGPARAGDLVALQRLLAAGADPNTQDPGGNHWTPLLHAIHKDQPGAVDLLLRSGADPRRTVNGLPPLLMAVGTGNTLIVRRLLEAGADPVSDDRIFLTAVAGGALSDLDNPLLGRCNTDVVRALQQRAPDLRVPRGTRGHVAMIVARLNHCGDVVRLAARTRE